MAQGQDFGTFFGTQFVGGCRSHRLRPAIGLDRLALSPALISTHIKAQLATGGFQPRPRLAGFIDQLHGLLAI
jgi:hypothetical protein